MIKYRCIKCGKEKFEIFFNGDILTYQCTGCRYYQNIDKSMNEDKLADICDFNKEDIKLRPANYQDIIVGNKIYIIDNMGKGITLETIRKIKEFDVTFLRLNDGHHEWICAYVRFDNPNKIESCNFNNTINGEVIGIDTNHCRNRKMNINERMEDAIEQITVVINYYISN